MPSLSDYATQSVYSDPRHHAGLLDELPAELPGLAAAVRNVIAHYRAAGIEFAPDHLAEIDNRWVDRILDADRRRFDTPLVRPRPVERRVAGCCRDFTLLTVAALRAKGVPARSRIGFAGYFEKGWHHDHVITEFWDGSRWVFADTQLDPAGDWPFDTLDMPPLGPGSLESAAQVWTGYRRGELDVDTYGVAADLPIRGGWFVRNYVLLELAHRQRDELLLWDGWGEMTGEDSLDGSDLALIDEVAALLLAADGGDGAAGRRLESWYAEDPRLHPGERVESFSPRGLRAVVDLRARRTLESVSSPSHAVQ